MFSERQAGESCGVMKFNVATDLILEVKWEYGKYIADLEQKKAMEGAFKRKKDRGAYNEKKKKNQEDKSLQETIDEDIRLCENSFKAVNGIIAYTNVTLRTLYH